MVATKQEPKKFVEHGFYIALIYLIISGGYLSNTLGCKVQKLFQENMLIKHIIGLFTTYFLVILADAPKNFTNKETIVFSVFVYFWFFMTTKMQVYFWIPMILLMMLAYCIYSYMKQAYDDNTKVEHLAVHQEKKILEPIQTICLFTSIILTVIGVLVYYGEKKIEYGTQFDPWIFWAGKPECRERIAKIPITKSLKHILL